jgi:hypothetical protein
MTSDVPTSTDGKLAFQEIADHRLAGVQPRPDRFRVMIDPAGHPFCLVLSDDG